MDLHIHYGLAAVFELKRGLERWFCGNSPGALCKDLHLGRVLKVFHGGVSCVSCLCLGTYYIPS